MIEALVIRVVTAICAAIMAIIAKNATYPNKVLFFRETLEETSRYQ